MLSILVLSTRGKKTHVVRVVFPTHINMQYARQALTKLFRKTFYLFNEHFCQPI